MADALEHTPDWENDPIDVICRGISGTWDSRPYATYYSNMEPRSAAAPANPYGRKGIPGNATEARRKKWSAVTPEQRAKIIRLIGADLKYAEVAIEAGVGQSTVERIASEEGIGRGQGAAGGAICIVPGCDRHVAPTNRTGICQAHGRNRGREKGDQLCAVPGCGRHLAKNNQSEVCKGHRCVAPYCRCKHCVGAG